MSMSALVVLIVHLFAKPFKKMYINIIEAAILLNLLLVTVAFLDPSNTPVPFEFSTVLVLLPYGYAIGYLVYASGLKIWYICLRAGSSDHTWSYNNKKRACLVFMSHLVRMISFR